MKKAFAALLLPTALLLGACSSDDNKSNVQYQDMGPTPGPNQPQPANDQATTQTTTTTSQSSP